MRHHMRNVQPIPTGRLITDSTYKGLPLAENGGPFTTRDLDYALATIEGAMRDSPKLVIACMELLIPRSIATYMDRYSDDTVKRFLTLLQQRARWKQTEQSKGKTIKRRATIDYIVKKDQSESLKSYRVMLIMNREAYDKQNPFYTNDSTLTHRIRTTWAKTLNQPEHAANSLVKLSDHYVKFVDSSAEGLIEVFGKASRLCTADSAEYGLGCYSFHSSRQDWGR
jgi:hypothetical protein